MIGLEDRQALARDIDVAHAAGARLKPACETASIDLRTLQRWQAGDGLVGGDRRPQAVAMPSPKLSGRRCSPSPTRRALLPCHQHASSRCWLTKAFIWPANPPSAASCEHRGKLRRSRFFGQSDKLKPTERKER